MPFRHLHILSTKLPVSFFKALFASLHHAFTRKLVLSLAVASLTVAAGTATAVDLDGDGIQDGVDIDDDNDGILDSVEGTLLSPTGPVVSASSYTFTPAGNPGNVGDTTVYPNAGSFNGTSFDLRLTVVSNTDTANLTVDMDGHISGGILYPILLDGTATTGTVGIDFEFLVSGTTTPIIVPSVFTWIDIDADEKVTILSSELSEYQLGNPTSITAATAAGSNTTFSSNVSGGPADEYLWVRTTLLSNSKFTFHYDKRTGNTGYIWNIDTYTSGATPVILNPEAFYAGDADGDGIANNHDLDSDNDGISDLLESGTAASNVSIDADSSGSISITEADAALGAGFADVDNDGLIDLFDADTASTNDVLSEGTVPVNTDSDADEDFLDLDSDADGIPDTVEARPTAGYIANDGNVADQDADLDGVIDLFDSNDTSSGDFGGTFSQPEDTDIDSTPDYLDGDSDDDALNDSTEIVSAITPSYPDPDGSVSTTLASLKNTDSQPADVDFRSLNDADGDGVPDSTDTNTTNPCIPNMGGTPSTKDCDGDGNPVATDPDPNSPNAGNDSGAAGATINLLSNDDYLPNNDAGNVGTTAITPVATGSSCTGTPTFNATTGTLVYSSAATETSGSCTLVYQVCSTPASGTPVCSTASVTISLADTDGDGVPDDLDSKPNDACVPNTSGTPGSKDCDGDGNPASSDPDPAAPNAANDSGVPGTAVNLLSNDDYLPNNDPANLGTTAISAIATGTSCAGTPSFDATTGNMTYTPAASEVSGSCTIAYQVCSTPSGGGSTVCSTAVVTMALSDTDGDGVPDNLDSDPANACIPNAGGTPGSKDCDGDGNPASTDPAPSTPTATNDTGTAGTPFDLLANDDFLPNSDPANLGTTSISAVATGTTCSGTPSFSASAGTVTYMPGPGETAGSCALVYQVCNTPSGGGAPVCANATATITIADVDGDGIPDSIDSNPADACVPNASGLPGTKDCDGDGNPASSDPNPAAPNAANDTGGSGLPIDLLSNDDFLPNNDPANLGNTTITGVSSGTTCAGTSNFDAATGNMTYTPDANEITGTCVVEYQVCNTALTVGAIPVCDTAQVTITLADSDGDGVPDHLDSAPSDACIPNASGTPGSKDCDNDGNPASSDPDPATPNATNDSGSAGLPIDLLSNDDFLPNNDPDNAGTTTISGVSSGTTCVGTSNFDAATGSLTYTPALSETSGSCTVAYQVCSVAELGGTTVCETAVATIALADSDGDGVPDNLDSDPANACVPNATGTPASKDCDGDGNPASNDPDPGTPSAENDTGAPGTPIDILANDDFLPNNDPANLGNTIIVGVATGTTCSGPTSFDAATGSMTYTPATNEVSGSCDVVYQVCNAPGIGGTPVCETATVTLTLGDSDGDGIPDSLDTDPVNACIPNVTGMPGTKDCDNDGNPAATDPDPAKPNASNDAGVPGTTVDVLANDDYLPNNDPSKVGTTTLAHVGGTCSGGVTLDANAGTINYTSGAGDTGSSCTIIYEVCSNSSGALNCQQAELLIGLNGTNPQPNPPIPGVPDSDNDGIPDSIEGTGDTDGDGIPDYLDLDSDNDGLLDAVEMFEDTDGDGVPDYRDLDSDNDGLTDTFEAGGADTDGDGVVDGFSDTNNDGWSDNVAIAPLPEPDFDSDGVVDYLDLDSDDDGLTDIEESMGQAWDLNDDGMIDNPIDLNDDGLADGAVTNNIQDADQDGDRDHLDLNGNAAPQQGAAGEIKIGLSGNGCSVAANTAGFDPVMPLLVLLSIFFLKLRRRVSQVRWPHKASWLIVASLALSGCSLGGLDRLNPFGNRSATNDRVAAGQDKEFQRHFYAGTGVGASWLEPDTSEVPGVDVDERVNAGGQATLGFDFSKHLSFELHTADLGSAGLSPTGRINYHMHGGSALIYAGGNRDNHVRRGLSGFGRLGYGTLDDSAVGDVNYVELNNTHVLFGAGLEYATRSGFGLRAELISFDEDVKYGQLGLLYRMGGKHRQPPVEIVKAPPVVEPVVLPTVPAVQIPAPLPDPCAQFNGVLEGVNFHTDSDRLTSSAQTILNGVAQELALCPGTPVAISAHTDDRGSDAYNIGLSKRRALSVARHLKGQGIETARMSARAYGEKSPIATNATKDGRAKNRRVELVAR